MMKRVSCLWFIALVAGACTEPSALPRDHSQLSDPRTWLGTAPPDDPFALTLPRGSACAAPEHRQFDFWSGKWQVNGPAGALLGTNEILIQLRGCLLAENWISAAGFRGRSMNMYDHTSGQWHQTWVDQSGINLRISGGVSGQSMVLGGPRGALLDRITWTPNPDGLRQHWEISTDGGATFTTFFDGRYVALHTVVPVPPLASTLCQTNVAYRDLDFWVGEWLVSVEDGLPLGRSTVQADLEGCLIEEHFRGLGSFESRSFISFGRAANRWFRTYIDSEGRRVQLSGPRTSEPPVLVGTRANPGSPSQTIRMSWHILDHQHVRHLIEVSSDGGITFGDSVTLLYRRLN